MAKKQAGDHSDLKVVNSNAAAIDIGSKMHMAAVHPDRADLPVRVFGTFTRDLHDLADWFRSCGVTSVAMESTGVYWIPAFEILEQHGFDVILVNARYA
ncbi:transposase, partial [Paracoccus sp. MC1854]